MKKLLIALFLLCLLLPACGRTPAPGIDQSLLDTYGMEHEEILTLLGLTEKDLDSEYESGVYCKKFDWFGKSLDTRIALLEGRKVQIQLKVDADQAFCETILKQLVEQLGEPEMSSRFKGENALEKMKAYLENPSSDNLWFWFLCDNPEALYDYRHVPIGAYGLIPVHCVFQKDPDQPDRCAVEIRLFSKGPDFPGNPILPAPIGIDERLLEAYDLPMEKALELLELTDSDHDPQDRNGHYIRMMDWFGWTSETRFYFSADHYGAAWRHDMSDDFCKDVIEELAEQFGEPQTGYVLWSPGAENFEDQRRTSYKGAESLQIFFGSDRYQRLTWEYDLYHYSDFSPVRPIRCSITKTEDSPYYNHLEILIYDGEYCRTTTPAIDPRLLEAYGMFEEDAFKSLGLADAEPDPDRPGKGYIKDFDWFGRTFPTYIYLDEIHYGVFPIMEADEQFCRDILTQILQQFGKPEDGYSLVPADTPYSSTEKFEPDKGNEALETFLKDTAYYSFGFHLGEPFEIITEGLEFYPINISFIRPIGTDGPYNLHIYLFHGETAADPYFWR